MPIKEFATLLYFLRNSSEVAEHLEVGTFFPFFLGAYYSCNHQASFWLLVIFCALNFYSLLLAKDSVYCFPLCFRMVKCLFLAFAYCQGAVTLYYFCFLVLLSFDSHISLRLVLVVGLTNHYFLVCISR